MKVISLAILLSIQLLVLAQDPSVEEILQKTREYYQSGKNNSFTVKTMFKSSIANDTSSSLATFFVTGKAEDSYLLITDNDRYNYLCSSKYYIYFDTDIKKYDLYNSKTVKDWGYYPVYTALPFSDPDRFFNEFRSARIISKNEDSWVLKDGNDYLQVSMRDYGVERMYTIKNTRWGVEYSEYRIMQAGYKQPEKTLQEYADYILSNFSPEEESTVRKKLTTEDVGIEFADFSILSVNKNVYTKENLRGRYVAFDLFYQSCLPCIKSFPDWIELRKNYDTSQLIILGIDHRLSDTLNMKKFMERYSINYDVVVGEDGEKIRSIVGNSGFPYTIVLDPNGKLCFVIEYYQPKLFKKLKKFLAENIK